jgi:hypothetical protein
MRDAVGERNMVWLVVFVVASAAVGVTAKYAAQEAVAPRLQHRPGTPIEIVAKCREAVIAAGRAHASEMNAELVRVDATSAGAMRSARDGQTAPVEVGLVYSRPSGPEARQAMIECRIDRSGRVSLAGRADQPNVSIRSSLHE